MTVNIDSDIFIYTLFTAITSVCMCKIFLIYINYIIVNFRKKLYSCQAITHFFTNYQILAPPTPCPLPPPQKKKQMKTYIFPNFTPPTDTVITAKHQKKHHSAFLLIVYNRIEFTFLKISKNIYCSPRFLAKDDRFFYF